MSRQDMNELLSDGIGTAAQFLKKSGEFYPFAVVKTVSGDIRHIQALTETDRPKSSAVRKLLEGSLRDSIEDEHYRTVMIVTNVELTDSATGKKYDAISLEIDDVDADPILCYVPYDLEAGSVNLGKVKASAGQRIAFFQ